MTIADEVQMTHPEDFDTEFEKTWMHWSDGTLGVLSAISLLLVGYLVKTHSDLSWKLLLISSFLTTSLFVYILGYLSNTDSIPEKLLHAFHKNVKSDTDMTTFPPLTILCLSMLKKFGTTFGFCSSATVFIMVMKLLVKIEVRERKNRVEIDLEDEDWAASEQEHRESLVIGLKALSAGILGIGILHLLLVDYIDTLNLHNPVDILPNVFESLKILLPLCSILVTLLIWMFLDNRTETRELAMFLSSLLLALVTILHVVALRLVRF